MISSSLTCQIPRLLVAAPASGSGKTTLTCALLMALVRRAIQVGSFKCGPDFIDPMFHQTVIGIPSRNLDLYLSGEEGVRFLLARAAKGLDLAILEGVMGLYDGVSGQGDQASSNHLALLTQTPTVLVVSVRGMGHSLLALIQGFLNYQENTIQGVILNQCSAARYPEYKAEIEAKLGLPVLGYLPPLPAASLGSRHLGLITAAEIADLNERMVLLGQTAETSLDLDALIELAQKAPSFTAPNLWPALPRKTAKVRIGLANDRAFCFHYQDNLDLLVHLGAELIEFSPLQDAELPGELAGLILPGGYPELYAPALSANQIMRESIARAIGQGLPLLAECGGFMYLHETFVDQDGQNLPMAGAIPGKTWMTGKLKRFGYLELTAETGTPLVEHGGTFKAHEFHYSDSDALGSAMTARKRDQSWPCIVANEQQMAGYPHVHFAARPEMAARFLTLCRNFAATEGGMET